MTPPRLRVWWAIARDHRGRRGVDHEATLRAEATSRTSQRCWLVERQIPLQSEQNIDVPVRAILAGAPPFSPSTPADDSVCGRVDRTSLAVHFLYFIPGSQADATLAKTVNVDVDTLGPQRPSAPRVDLEADPSALRVSTELTSAELGLRVYCNTRPPPADAGEGDVCPTKVYGVWLNEYIPDDGFEASFACDDRVPVSSESALVRSSAGRHFEDDGRWAFNLAYVDAFGNSSTLSDSTCLTLEKRTAPESDGGCAISGRGSSDSPNVLFVVFGMATLLVVARRRSR
jgi:hypothetical protein